MEQYFAFVHHDLRSGMTIIFACMVIICLAALVDLSSAIDAAHANKEHIRSKPLRKTGIKIIDYYRLFVFCIMIDCLGLCFEWYILPYSCVLYTAAVLLIEGLSVAENLKRKKSQAAEVKDVVAKIVSCVTKEEAEKIIELLRDQQTNHKNRNYNRE